MEMPFAIGALKHDLMKAISDRLDRFEIETGLMPRRIELEFVDVTTRGDEVRKYRLSDVNVEFRF